MHINQANQGALDNKTLDLHMYRVHCYDKPSPRTLQELSAEILVTQERYDQYLPRLLVDIHKCEFRTVQPNIVAHHKMNHADNTPHFEEISEAEDLANAMSRLLKLGGLKYLLEM